MMARSRFHHFVRPAVAATARVDPECLRVKGRLIADSVARPPKAEACINQTSERMLQVTVAVGIP